MRVIPDEFQLTIWPSDGGRGAANANTAAITPSVSPLCDQQANCALTAQRCRSAVDALAPRQRDVLAAMVAGYSNKQIAHLLSLSPRTVEVYRAGIMNRLHVRTLALTLYIAFMAGLTPFDSVSFSAG